MITSNKENGLSWKALLKDIELDDATVQENYFRRATALFFKINKELPSVVSISGERTRFDLDKALLAIKEEFKLNDDRLISIYEYIVKTKESRVDQTLCLLEQNLFLSFDNTFNYGFTIHYCNKTDPKLIEKIKSLLDNCKREIEPHYAHILVQGNSGQLTLRSFKMEPFEDDVIGLNYNEDFRTVNEIIVKRLQEPNGNGIALLHGLPGTGKTSYIRYLISKLRKRVIYFP